ncbi:hypothetical protein L9G16_07050 [Shewanella sp. A25]|nr:hypothetical protein [Shewanella shenzhenensis]
MNKFILILTAFLFSAACFADTKLSLSYEMNNIYVSMYNYSGEDVEFEYMLCVEPHGGVSFEVEDEQGTIYPMAVYLNSGCDRRKKLKISRYSISGSIIDKGFIQMIYAIPNEKLYLTAFMCEVFFTKKNCVSSNKVLIDFSQSEAVSSDD